MKLNYFILVFIANIALGLGISVSDKQLKNASITDYPWFGTIELNNKLHCSCVIITRNDVLTAAHCVSGLDKNSLIVRVGTDEREINGRVREVEAIINHPNFREKKTSHPQKIYDNDIAIVRVKKPFWTDADKSDNIKAATLYEESEELASGVSVVVGYGVGGSGLSPVLQSYWDAFYLKWSNTICKNLFKDQVSFLSSQICAFSIKKGEKIASQEDVGTLFMLNDKLAGILSYLKNYSYPVEPEIYTKISSFRKWIDDNKLV